MDAHLLPCSRGWGSCSQETDPGGDGLRGRYDCEVDGQVLHPQCSGRLACRSRAALPQDAAVLSFSRVCIQLAAHRASSPLFRVLWSQRHESIHTASWQWQRQQRGVTSQGVVEG